jgi:large repetitive protein
VKVTGGTPTGQVQLLENGVLTIGSIVGGSASLTTGNLAVGPHSISARYLGDSNTLASSGGMLNVTVTGATTVAITTSPAVTPAAPPINVTIN